MPGVRSLAMPAVLTVALAEQGFLASQLPAGNKTRGASWASEGFGLHWSGRFMIGLEQSGWPEVCISVEDDLIEQDAKMLTMTCDKREGQFFTYNDKDLQLRLACNPDFCVAPAPRRFAVGTQVMLRRCREAGVGRFWLAEQTSTVNGEPRVRFILRNSNCLGVDQNFVGLEDGITLASTVSGNSHQCFHAKLTTADPPTEPPVPTPTPTPLQPSPTPAPPALTPSPTLPLPSEEPPALTPSPTLPLPSEEPPSPVEDCGVSESMCGSHGRVTAQCCEGMECQTSSRNKFMTCVACSPEGEVCGSNGEVTQACCSGMTCQATDCGGVMECRST
eukprot:TRINITY_DN36796_c0_g1_i1.p1 TRINITY_DN36796_c0_g1~~TRINITY_DN36796_c0_g1_i1.p1  ORF type:complete len:333 (+),score=42.37 TRINITY_DN36796_c0_g1_i1:83-1081(+)